MPTKPRMERKLRIRVAFEPTRLSAEWLQGAFELVLPVARRRIGDELTAATSDTVEADAERGSTKERP